MPEAPYQGVTIVGVGLIGGSVAKALRERGLASQVVGYARSEATAERLRKLDILDSVETNLGAAVADAEVVVFAAPVESIPQLIADAAPHCSQQTLLTDAGSTKRRLVDDVHLVLEGLDDPPVFVGAHPMAGDHRTGAEAARADLFQDALTVLTPTGHTPIESTCAAEAFWQSLGCRTLILSPKEHDQHVARASHVPHVAASAVAATTTEESLPLTATGWRDTTRVAAGSPELWREILLSNREAVAEGLRSLSTEIDAYLGALDEGDGARLQKLLQQGKERRDAMGS